MKLGHAASETDSGHIFLRTSLTRARLISRPVNDECARILLSDPIRVLTSACIYLAIKSLTFGSRVIPASKALCSIIFLRVVKSGLFIFTIKPPSNLDLNRASRCWISLGGRSEASTICFCALYKVLNVWKNSSWVLC